MKWRTCASTTLLPTMSSVGLTKMARQSIVNSARVLSQIINSLTQKKEDEKERYFYSLFLLFVTFRNEDELTEEGESAEDAFNKHMEYNDALNIHCDKLQTMMRANENVQKITKLDRQNSSRCLCLSLLNGTKVLRLLEKPHLQCTMWPICSTVIILVPA